MMRILICDDEIGYLNDLKIHVEEYMKSHFLCCHIDAYIDPTEIYFSDKIYDLVFLDIQMNEVNGISLAKELKKRNGKTVIFFVTSYNEYQDDAMDVRAFRFFEKPFDTERLYASLNKAMEYIDESYVDVFIYDNKQQKRVLVDSIILIKRENRKIIMKTTESEFITNKPFDEWCNILPNTFFYQVHKSYLVNMHYVDIYKYTELFLTDGTRVSIAPRKQSEFHKYWFSYLRRR